MVVVDLLQKLDIEGVQQVALTLQSAGGDNLWLFIENITRNQAGEYRCQASNPCGDASETVTIDVQCKLFVMLSLNTLFIKLITINFLYW